MIKFLKYHYRKPNLKWPSKPKCGAKPGFYVEDLGDDEYLQKEDICKTCLRLTKRGGKREVKGK